MNVMLYSHGDRSRHPRYGGLSTRVRRQSSISGHQFPARPGDSTPRIMDDMGQTIMPGLDGCGLIIEALGLLT